MGAIEAADYTFNLRAWHDISLFWKHLFLTRL